MSEKVDYNMTQEEKELAVEYDKLTKKIKDLGIQLKKLKIQLESNRTNQAEEINIKEKIIETERQIKYHIFARNKISDKLYGSEVSENVNN